MIIKKMKEKIKKNEYKHNQHQFDTLATKSRCKSTMGKNFFNSFAVSSGNKCCSIPGVINSLATESMDVKYDCSLDKSSEIACC